MKKADPRSLENLPLDHKSMVVGLAIGCPLGEPISSCPLEEYRDMPYKKILDLTNNMGDNDFKKLYKSNLQCIRRREIKYK